MRSYLAGATVVLMSFSSSAWAGPERTGFPPYAFARAWTSLPIDHFGPTAPDVAPVKVLSGTATAIEDTKLDRLLDEALASAADPQMRRGLALNAMMTPWPDAQRTAFQKLREAQVAYAPGDEAHAQRFVALVTRVVDGTGRSAAFDGSASSALDTAYAAALSREDDGARAKTEAAQTAFVAYRDAFAAFADGHSLGTGTSVAAELDRQRAADLAAERR